MSNACFAHGPVSRTEGLCNQTKPLGLSTIMAVSMIVPSAISHEVNTPSRVNIDYGINNK